MSASVKVTATVTAVSGGNTPTGTVSFTVGGTTLGSSNVAGSGPSGTTSLVVSGTSLAGGANTIVANYDAAGSFSNASASAVITVTQPPTATVTTLTVDSPRQHRRNRNRPTHRQCEALRRGWCIPAGTVTFLAGNKALGSVALSNANGIATLSVQGSSLAAGSNGIVAAYGGSAGFIGSTSIPVIVTVGVPGNATNTGVTASPSELLQSAQTVITATVKAFSGSGAPTGTVSFTSRQYLAGHCSRYDSGRNRERRPD